MKINRLILMTSSYRSTSSVPIPTQHLSATLDDARMEKYIWVNCKDLDKCPLGLISRSPNPASNMAKKNTVAAR